MTNITDTIKEVSLNVEAASSAAYDVTGALEDARLALRKVDEHSHLLAEYQDEFLTPDDAAEAKSELEEFQMYFDDSDEARRCAEKLEEFDDLNLEAYEVQEIVDELEDFQSLGMDVIDLRDLIDQGSEDSDELKRTNAKLEEELVRQANLIARLATALEEINTITQDELIGTGGTS